MDADDFRRRLVPGADLRGVTFPAFDDLDGVDLHGADLRNVDLRAMGQADEGPDLANTNLSGADLRGAQLGTPSFDGADLSGATLAGLDLGGVQFGATSFIGADLTGADLSRLNVNGALFTKAVLDGANLIGADLTSCWLVGASMVGARLNGADLRRANLRSADLRGADLTGAVLPDKLSAFDGARFDSSTRWDETMRTQAEANSVAEPDGTRVITLPQPPAEQPRRIWPLVGRYAVVLPIGAGITTMAVLTVTGDFVWVDGAGEPTTNIVVRLLLGLVYGVWGLTMMASGIFGFPEGSHSSGTSGSSSSGGGVEGCFAGADVD